MANRGNAIEVRARLLADELARRTAVIADLLVDGGPPFHVPVPEVDQLRQYLETKSQPDGLLRLRQSFGGPHPDDEVDRYVQSMERLAAKHAPSHYLDEQWPRLLLGHQSPFGPALPDQPAPDEEA